MARLSRTHRSPDTRSVVASGSMRRTDPLPHFGPGYHSMRRSASIPGYWHACFSVDASVGMASRNTEAPSGPWQFTTLFAGDD
jgi:hypothetical protein